ncbi:MAG: SDR family oxidoreductase, partial [Pseudomonadota bacterium]
MRTLVVLGSTGQVGRELARCGLPPGWRMHGPNRHAADLTAPTALARALGAVENVAAVVNAAAYTAVERAETEPTLAFAVNAEAPGVLAGLCAERGLPFVHLSTDYVFDGRRRPGGWREDDPPVPLGVYGRSKAAGERAALDAGGRATVLRTSWVFSPFGRNFLTTMLHLGRMQSVVRVVADQIG